MDIEKLNRSQLAACLTALIHVLNQRKHVRVIMGKEVLVEGSLSKALKLPELLKQINSVHRAKQDKAILQFIEIWPTLSETTRELSINALGWYEPNDLEWDDPRSNKKTRLSGEDKYE